MTGNVKAAKPESLAQPARRAVLLVAVNLVLALALVDGALRMQQAFGPLYDLDVKTGRSHSVSPTSSIYVLPTATEWNADGIRWMRVANSARCAPKRGREVYSLAVAKYPTQAIPGD